MRETLRTQFTEATKVREGLGRRLSQEEIEHEMALYNESMLGILCELCGETGNDLIGAILDCDDSKENISNTIDKVIEDLGVKFELYPNPLVRNFQVDYMVSEDLFEFTLTTILEGHDFRQSFETVEELLKYLCDTTGLNEETNDVAKETNLWDIKDTKDDHEDITPMKVQMIEISNRDQLLNIDKIYLDLFEKTRLKSIKNLAVRVLNEFKQTPFINTSSSKVYDLRDGHFIYVKANAQIGLGIMNTNHCINGLMVNDDISPYLSDISIGGTIMGKGKTDMKQIEELVNEYNENSLFEGSMIQAIIYFN